MKKNGFIFSFLLFLFLGCYTNNSIAQHFIGLTKPEVTSLMKATHKNFYLDNTINKTFNYLKYVDALNEQTWLLFLSDKDVCTHTKLMCDYILLEEKLAELNKNYTSTALNTWEYTHEGKKYQITLEKGEWYFTIFTKLKVNK